MSELPPKATSVTPTGEPDGWSAPRGWRRQEAPDGSTRVVVSVPSAELRDVHLRLLRALKAPLGVRYVRLTDRMTGQLPKPASFVRMDLPTEKVLAALEARPELVWHDGRHQLWVRGALGEQVVLDEMGVLYGYPDDPSFRDALGDLPETSELGMDGRDYVRVVFRAEADAQEQSLIEELGLMSWGA